MEHQTSLFALAPSTSENTPRRKHTMLANWHIFIDGASRGNPGPAGTGIYIELDGKAYKEYGFFWHEKTNNQAEYLALVSAAFFIRKLIKESDAQTHRLTITADSELLIKQMSGAYKVRNPDLLKLFSCARALLHDLQPTFRHVLRSSNKKADALANKGIDEKILPPKSLIAILEHHGVTY